MLKFIVKCILILFNLIFAIIGAAIIAVGAIIHFQIDQILNKIPDEILTLINSFSFLPIVVIVIGCVIFLIAYPGCCGAIRESKCLLITYSCIMVVLAAVKIYIVVTLFKNIGTYQGTVENFVDEAFTDPRLNNTFHFIEYTFKCCGTNGADSYDGVLPYLPPSCCEGVADTCLVNASIESCYCAKDHAYIDGCSSLLAGYFGKYAEYAGYGFITAIATEILAMAFAVYLITSIEKY